MRNSRRSFVTALMIIVSLMLIGGLLVISEHAMTRNPTTTRETATPRRSAPSTPQPFPELMSALAQDPPFQCVANAATPPVVHGEGYTELVDDLKLQCEAYLLNKPRPPETSFTMQLNTGLTNPGRGIITTQSSARS